jgi:serine/threonine protein kinase
MVSIRGPFDKKFLARGTQSREYFTKEGFVYESEEMSGSITILRSKRTCLRARIECDDAEFIDFIEMLLSVDPDARPSAAEALEHRWLSKQLTM